MDMDELLPPRKTQGPLAELAREDLDRLSRDEVLARIAALEAEIGRCRVRLERADSLRSAAEGLFRT
jgi:uncharacterized small protein (DUF1192 family)